jgi:hypothetical protein
MRCWIAKAAAAALMLGAWTAQAQGLSGQASPVKVPKTEQEWQSWAKAQAGGKDWIYVDHTATGALLVPEFVDMRPVFDLPLRMEFARPLSEDPPILSTAEVVEVDCMNFRRRTLMIRGYPLNGMKGQPDDRALPDDWSALGDDSLTDVYIMEICEKARSMRWEGGDEGPETLSQADMDAWIAKTVKPGRDVFAFNDEAGANYVVGGAFSRTASGTLAFEVRLELYEPAGEKRSRSMKVELDCRGKRLKLGETRDYPQHNLEGATSDSPPMREDWYAPADMLQSLSMTRLCDMAKARGLQP